jgi:ABC-type transport system substrate-binding protein
VKSKKILAAVMAAAMAASVLAGCGSKTPGGEKTDGPDKDQYLNVVLGVEPKSLDASKSTDLYSSIILTEVNEGLTRIEQDENGKDVVKPAGADTWEVKDNGTKWVFHLRDYTWSDGQKVTAQQFEYGIKRTLDPKVGSAYAFLLYPIKGAVEYNTKKGTADQVGVKALDEKTLEFTLAGPTPFFLLSLLRIFSRSYTHAISISGTAMMNENSAAAVRFMPNSRPPAIVEPEREKPGHSDRIWNRPTKNAWRMVISSTSRVTGRLDTHSATNISTAPATRPMMTVNGEKRYALIGP